MNKNDRRFVNPYTFVPFPVGGIKRENALGHTFSSEEAQVRYSGTFQVNWHLMSPLSLPEGQDWYSAKDRTVSIPGSSVKGAVRSVHETLFGGCPRVLTEEFVPVYREPVTKNMLHEWRLAVVVDAKDGTPSRIHLCEEDPVWINAVALKHSYGGGVPRTGDVLTIRDRPMRHNLGRLELPARRQARLREFKRYIPRDEQNWPIGSYVLLVTDVAARPTTRNQHDQQRDPIPAPGVPQGAKSKNIYKQEVAACFWAAGKLTGDIVQFATRSGIPPLARFARLSEDTRDLQEARQASRLAGAGSTYGSPFEPVSWWRLDAGTELRRHDETSTAQTAHLPVVAPQDGRLTPARTDLWQVVGERRKADGRLLVGDVIWVQCARQDEEMVVTAVKLAAAWRKTPCLAGNLGERVGATSCRSWEELCLSCAVFGSADTTGDAGGAGQQDSYRGHVRFGSVTGTGIDAGSTPITLAPLSSPRPGAGQFYLENQPLPDRSRRKDGDQPGRWGSSLDTPARRRRLRGRKFYWHSDPDDQADQIELQGGVHDAKPRYAKSGGDGFQTSVWLAKQGQTLTQTVSFDGLDRLGLLTLLSAFDPDRILDAGADGGCAIHLGGGKPFGLGSARAEISDLQVNSVARRYLGGSDPPLDFTTWTTKDHEDLLARVGDLTQVHKAAAKVMAVDGLGQFEAYLTYPTTLGWARYSTPEFVRSFEYFAKNSGRKQTGTVPYGVLPDLGAVTDGASPAIEDGQNRV